ncbi:hypothetical protein [Vandammella animalimorsus]|uniref:Uncharacterized protein n=1 Tax=Vandammella animalimorsus TaxID=2029117 RepID=A0A2A2AJ78_9BURK|nr:hypothetical protein [Vandammella animalimorsus]PAT37803.1 hypothetical protein CK625_05970 [Vandammella animalimorsus]
MAEAQIEERCEGLLDGPIMRMLCADWGGLPHQQAMVVPGGIAMACALHPIKKSHAFSPSAQTMHRPGHEKGFSGQVIHWAVGQKNSRIPADFLFEAL